MSKPRSRGPCPSDTAGGASMRWTRPRDAASGGRMPISGASGARTSWSRGTVPAPWSAASQAAPRLSRCSDAFASASSRAIPWLPANSRKRSRTRAHRATPPVSRILGGLIPGRSRVSTFSAKASSSPARMRSLDSPRLARWVMSVLRITGQRPERRAGSRTGAARRPASSTPSPNRPVSCCRKFPVPWAQRPFSRNPSRPPSCSSRTEKPRLPMETTVMGRSPCASRTPVPSAWRRGTRARPTCRPRRPVTAAPWTVSQSRLSRMALRQPAGSLWCSRRILLPGCQSPLAPRSSDTLTASAPMSIPR